MNFNLSEFGNFSRPDIQPITHHHRQARFLGPLIGFFLASLFPNPALARLQQGSIKFQYDPLPSNPIINIYQTTQKPHVNSTIHHQQQLEPIIFPQHHEIEPIIEEEHVGFATSLESPYEYLVPPEPQQKYPVKRAIASRYNRFTATNNRRRFPEYDYYDYPRIKNTNNIRRRNQGRRPLFDYEDEFLYDYDYGKKRKQQQKRRNNKNKQPNRRDPDYYDNEYDDDVERVTKFKPRQQQQQDTTTMPTTTTQTTTMPTTTIQNGSTPSPPGNNNNNTTTGYGYGPYSGNENVSITYGPPSAIKPIYGVPGQSYGVPSGQSYNEWVPNSYLYDSPSTSYVYPSSVTYGLPSSSPSYSSVSYGSPIYSKPSASYGPPSTSYGVPSQSYGVPSQSYGTPSQSYGTPSQSYGTPSQSYGVPSSQTPSSQPQGSRVAYQSYQLPFSSWYGRSGSHQSQSDLVRRVQDLF